MRHRPFARQLLRTAAWLIVTGVAAGCSGGGGGVNPMPAPAPAPTPVPTPTPAPAPTPTPTPTGFDTAEYRATVGAVSANALAAYNQGGTGAGITVAVIDSGIDLDSPEFGNRISPASADVTGGNRSVDDAAGHGTAVGFTIAGRANDTGTHGIAFEATLLVARADTPDSCTGTNGADGCTFADSAIAGGVDLARTNGARVINISLGGGAPNANLLQAIGRATAAGIVVVVAAGNDGTADPDPLGSGLAESSSGRGLVIIAGSVGANNSRTPGADVISDFSDRAGRDAAYFLSAVGERVAAPNQSNVGYAWSGTSFASPQISGAVALLAQAFPNLTGAQIVSLLLSTARDAGAPGTDVVYGRGVLDLTAAFQPVGTTTIAGTHAGVSLAANAALSAPMGDARQGTLGAVILDGFSRAYAIDLARTISRESPTRTLAEALQSRGRNVTAEVGGTAMAMTIAPVTRSSVSVLPTMLSGTQTEQARAIAGIVTRRFGGSGQIAFGFAEGGAVLTARMTRRAEPAFLVAADPIEGQGFDSRIAASTAWRQRLGRWGVTAAIENGDVLSHDAAALPALRYRWQRSDYRRSALTIDRRLGRVALAVTGSWLAESGTVLGARFGAGLGGASATSWFADAAARWNAARGWSLGASVRQGWTRADTEGALAGRGVLRTSAFAADIGKDRVFSDGDSFGIRVAQPLRVSGGGINLRLPVDYDYSSGEVTGWSIQRLNLAPEGREIDVEARYGLAMFGGEMQTNFFWRTNPGNYAALPDDRGAALRWSRGF